jgi:hypothetical protein
MESDEEAIEYPPQVRNKQEYFENVPLFLSDQYRRLYIDSRNQMANTVSNHQDKNSLDKEA